MATIHRMIRADNGEPVQHVQLIPNSRLRGAATAERNEQASKLSRTVDAVAKQYGITRDDVLRVLSTPPITAAPKSANAVLTERAHALMRADASMTFGDALRAASKP